MIHHGLGLGHLPTADQENPKMLPAQALSPMDMLTAVTAAAIHAR